MEEAHSVTTEEEHSHYCRECGGVWIHADESCMGPRFRGYNPYDPSFTCPMCMDPD
jgi:hypothetical protein